MSQWTFVTNHAVVLSLISRYPVITGRELALKIGISERAVRRIIAELQDAGYIQKKKEGRRMRYQVKHQTPLRHKTQGDKAVGELLKVLNPQQETEEKRQS
jgi:DNA-binding MarR family transcriptional regulator